MGLGGNKTQRVDIIDSVDPRVAGRAAQKGTLFRYIPAVGNPTVLIKTDDGFSTNWSEASQSESTDTTFLANFNLGVGNVTVLARKIGNLVCIEIPEINVADGQDSTLFALAAIPVGFRPTAEIVTPTVIVVNGVLNFGFVTLSVGGTIEINAGPSTAYVLTAGVPAQFRRNAFTYPVP